MYCGADKDYDPTTDVTDDKFRLGENCFEEEHEGLGCEYCPYGSERNQEYTPLTWTQGSVMNCVVPDDVVVEGDTLCYCHGDTVVENCSFIIQITSMLT
eukprot:UN32421